MGAPSRSTSPDHAKSVRVVAVAAGANIAAVAVVAVAVADAIATSLSFKRDRGPASPGLDFFPGRVLQTGLRDSALARQTGWFHRTGL